MRVPFFVSVGGRASLLRVWCFFESCWVSCRLFISAVWSIPSSNRSLLVCSGNDILECKNVGVLPYKPHLRKFESTLLGLSQPQKSQNVCLRMKPFMDRYNIPLDQVVLETQAFLSVEPLMLKFRFLSQTRLPRSLVPAPSLGSTFWGACKKPRSFERSSVNVPVISLSWFWFCRDARRFFFAIPRPGVLLVGAVCLFSHPGSFMCVAS